jgi:hypothetical protein
MQSNEVAPFNRGARLFRVWDAETKRKPRNARGAFHKAVVGNSLPYVLAPDMCRAAM